MGARKKRPARKKATRARRDPWQGWPTSLSIPVLRRMFAEYNPRRMSAFKYEELRWSIREFGYVQRVVCNKRSREEGWPARSRPTIVGGHQGVRASEDEGFTVLPVHWVDVTSAKEHKLNFILNNVSGEFIVEQVEEIVRRLKEEGDDLSHTGFGDDEIEAFLAGKAGRSDAAEAAARKTLRERFVVPPFSVLDARQGYWRERKAAWLALGIESELGREQTDTGKPGGLLIPSDSGRDPGYYNQKTAVERQLGRALTTEEFQREHYVPNEGAPGVSTSGTSVFDPVLCELVYRWFCPPGGRVLDPFAGGSVRGIVASVLGRSYVGIDLSKRQVGANRSQAKQILHPKKARRR